uniref:Neurotransmitter-gated ion-channel transmembrane domain-containing protein n=1 Tax=Acrobeloides nanus TaxID=290746 RepID=A0A914DA00_9BILA
MAGNGYYVDLQQLPHEQVRMKKDEDGSDIEFMDVGMDLKKYVDITYYLVLRRKTLFFTCNLIVPCFLISILTTFVFYLSDHKITFAISILVTLTVFFLVIIDILPPTSLVVPMFGRYLITTMCLVALSTVISVITVNFRFRSGSAHKMSPWIRSIFLNCLPKILMMKRPEKRPIRTSSSSSNLVDPATLLAMPTFVYPLPMASVNSHKKKRSAEEKQHKTPKTPTYFQFPSPGSSTQMNTFMEKPSSKMTSMYSSYHEGNNKNIADTSFTSLPKNSRVGNALPTLPDPNPKIDAQNARKRVNDIIFANILRQVRFIAEHFRKNEEEAEVSDDWTFVAMVLDRLFLIIFSIFNVATFLIILEAPSLYDTREPLNITIPTKPLGISIPHRRYP